MLTKLRRKGSHKVEVSSSDERVQVTVDHGAEPPMTKEEAHDALVKAEAVTHEFLAAVEADIEATAA